MTDHDLDQQLAAAFDVAPSSDFLARVRTAVAAESAPARWHFSWPLAVAGSAMVAAIGVTASIGWLSRDMSSSPRAVLSVPPSAPPAPTVATAPAVTSNTPMPEVSRSRQRSRMAVPAVAPTASSTFPTVIVSSDDARGLGVLIRAARAASIPAVLPMDNVSVKDALTVPRLEIAPVAIEPLADLTRLEQGDRQQ
jgi:hypothetical protein